MKIENNKIEGESEGGSVRLTPENEDDVWELLHLLSFTDCLGTI